MDAATTVVGVGRVVGCQWVTAPQCAGGGDGGVEVGWARQRRWSCESSGGMKLGMGVSFRARQQP
jgi:hypothetical protein